MDPIEYLKALRRRWYVLVAVLAVTCGVTLASTPATPPPPVVTYTATHTMLIGSDPTGVARLPIGLNQFELFATTGEVPRRVANQLGYEGESAALAAQVQVVVDQTIGTLRFSTTQQSPDEAVQIADAFAEVFTAFLAEQGDEIRQARLSAVLLRLTEQESRIRELDAELFASGGRDEIVKAQRDALVRDYGATFEQYQQIQQEQANASLGITTLEAAQAVPQVSGGFSAPRSRAERLPFALGIGLLLGAALALLLDRYDSRLRTRVQAENAFDTVVLGELPSLPASLRGKRTLIVRPEAQNLVAEAYRTLRTSVTLLSAGKSDRIGSLPSATNSPIGASGVIVVMSPNPGEGKTTTAANLGAAFAEAGARALLVNADFRRPALSKYFESSAGHRELALHDLMAAGIDQLIQPTDMPGLSILDLTSIDATPGDLSRAAARLLPLLRTKADVVIVDTPPLTVTAEALEYVPDADLVLMIARAGSTTTKTAEWATDLIRHAGVEAFAVVLTDAGLPRKGRYRYYRYYRAAGKRTRRAPGAPPVPRTNLDKLFAEATLPDVAGSAADTAGANGSASVVADLRAGAGGNGTGPHEEVAATGNGRHAAAADQASSEGQASGDRPSV